MPVFHPHLAHASEVFIDTDPSLPFVQLNFHAVFEENEDLDGTWEAWTDLPQVDKDGNVISQPAEWRAIPFEPHTNQSTAPQANGYKTDDRLVIEALKDYPSPPASTRRLRFAVTVPASAGSEFAYTYRHITKSGETHWLGGPGGNGFIRLISGPAKESDQWTASGSWSERPSSVDETQWYGVGIEWTGIKGSERPVIRTIPTDGPVAPSILLLQSSTPHDPSRLSKQVPSSASVLPSPNPQLLAVVGSEEPIDVRSGTALPAPTSGSQTTGYGLSRGASPQEALQGAMKAAKVQKDLLRLAEVQSKSKRSGEVAAFLARSGERDAVKTYLAVYAPASNTVGDLSVTIPDDLVEASPVAVIGTNGSSFVSSGSTEGTPGRQVRLHLEAGPIAEILQIASFVELRGAGAHDSIWICSPTATSIEVGEEEIDAPDGTAKTAPITSYEEVRSVSLVIEEPSVTTSSSVVDPQPLTSSTQETTQPESQPVIHPKEPASSSWWLLRFISRVFADIWGFIIWPFRSQPAISSGIDGELEDDDDDEDDEEARQTSTPPTERTPLLGSTSMSRETSSSSTAFDPLASPASVTTAKGDAIVTKYHSLGSVTPLGTEGNSPILDQAEAPVANTVQIQSYAQMSFGHIPPFKFLLPPGAVEAQNKLKFSYKAKADKDWNVVQPGVTAIAGQCVELLLDGVDDAGRIEWDVQVERT
ncbi:hypothetical protein I317_01174 [Kwoniella heveanensis CBS 569]|uniref:Uncharacterized protein n=1 Tax=Kwoniella heveanensis BCC8398 TaxID=1296120 RepID=A0A1B9GJU7_9TREE|nr:hypothetical protein I316_06975 [Kwoniella heveanensis BCC8398]OCF44895.1 hypothetical protein I317_01174 [Kwoniella heveanensis CBS 569]